MPVVRELFGLRQKPAQYIKILETRIDKIRGVLEGTQKLPDDEVLCDWVHFCYTFAMYTEGKDMFSLVSGNEVNTWYYERTKKIAKVCEQKAKLAEQRNE
jgi:hypothetical protein